MPATTTAAMHGWHATGENDTCTQWRIRARHREPRAPTRRRDKAEQTGDPPKKVERKQNELTLKRSPVSDHCVFVVCLRRRYWWSQWMGLKKGVSIVGKGKGKIRQDDWRGVELRGEMRQGEAPQSATKATPRLLHKQLALRRREVHRRGRSKGGRRKKSDVTRYRFFAIAWVALNRFPVFFQAEDEIADAKKAREYEEVLSRGSMTRGGSSRFTNYFAGDKVHVAGGTTTLNRVPQSAVGWQLALPVHITYNCQKGLNVGLDLGLGDLIGLGDFMAQPKRSEGGRQYEMMVAVEWIPCAAAEEKQASF
ncbi:hypothetical protein B0H14DRAFT_3743916 [Mycena olivaceomarginata]|nr:hypothetical protein B0H14DRAFT_3743916 [Mycena olivaceomarginata]